MKIKSEKIKKEKKPKTHHLRTKPTSKSGKSNVYFTKDHENAIIEYCSPECLSKRKQVLYQQFIDPSFNEMINKMVFTFRFSNLPNIIELKEECKAWLVSILGKFDPTRGFKAFSYFSVITKNWFIHKTKVIGQAQHREVSIDGEPINETEYR